MAVVFWRRLDVEGLERLELTPGPSGISVSGTLLTLDSGGLLLRHLWDLDADWGTRSVSVDLQAPSGAAVPAAGAGGHGLAAGRGRAARPRWRRGAGPVADPLLQHPCHPGPRAGAGATHVLDVAFIDGATLAVTRSRQAYRRLGPTRVLYRDLGVARGFEAELELDPDGMVRHYAGLFTRIPG